MICAIVAVDSDWGIGYEGDLLEHIPEDLKYFKQLTTGNVVIMGRKTWDSLPKKPLPNRFNIVVTRQQKMSLDFETVYMTLDTAKERAAAGSLEDVFVIGGGQIYKELLPYCDRVYVTKIYKNHKNIDTYFPNLDELSEWLGTASSPIQTYNDLSYQFWQYDRIS